MPDIDYNALSRNELTQLRADVDRALAEAGERDLRAAREAAEAAAQEHGFSLAELVGSAGTGRGRGKGRANGKGNGARGGQDGAGPSPAPTEVKYRNPENGEQTWSGRGRRPAWVHEALEGGRSLEDLAA